MTTIKTSVERYSEISPVYGDVTNAQIWVRSTEKGYIERVSVLPELPADHPVRMNMTQWGFQHVATVFADSVTAIVHKGFFRVKEGMENFDNSVYAVYGEDLRDVEDKQVLNVLMWKSFRQAPAVDDKGRMIKNQDGKIAYKQVGYVRETSMHSVTNKERNEMIKKYKSCALPLTIVARNITKIILFNEAKQQIVSQAYVAKMCSAVPVVTKETPVTEEILDVLDTIRQA